MLNYHHNYSKKKRLFKIVYPQDVKARQTSYKTHIQVSVECGTNKNVCERESTQPQDHLIKHVFILKFCVF